MIGGIRRIPANTDARNRFRGCLLGGAVGDALGAPVEFMERSEIIARFGEPGIRDFVPAYGKLGAITDDTQMTLFTAEGMMRAWVRFNRRGLGPVFADVTSWAYQRWLMTQGYASRFPHMAVEKSGWLMTHPELFDLRAPGLTCLHALKSMEAPGQRARNDSKGCGGVMRIAPVGMFLSHWIENDGSDTKEVFRVGADLAGLTHGHPTGYLAAGAMASIVALILRGWTLPAAVSRAKAELVMHGRHKQTLDAIEAAERHAGSEPGSAVAIRKLGKGWIAEEALAIGLYSALCARDFESGVVLAVNHDGDSDSTGSIAGNLLGAMLGASEIPPRWLALLELREAIEEIADDLATVREWRIEEDAETPESEFYWNRYPGN